MLTALFVLLMVTPAEGAGALHLLMEPGNQVFLDARSVGLSSEAAGGILLEGVPAGEHDVLIVTPSGARSSLKVNIFDGQTTTITLSSLGLRGARRRGEDSTVELQQAVTRSSRCELAVGSAKIAGAKDDLRVEHLSPGRQHVAIICGAQAAEGDVDVQPGRIVGVTPDFKTRTVRVVDDRPRITNMNVPSATDAIMRMSLPMSWKRAITGAMVAGIHAESITQTRGKLAMATFTAPNRATMGDFLVQLRSRGEVEEIESVRVQALADGIRASFYILFRTEE